MYNIKFCVWCSKTYEDGLIHCPLCGAVLSVPGL